ncbi:MAG: NifB/NifX family molybdenum-iron cluster-binding protein [Dehalobacterium sp.]
MKICVSSGGQEQNAGVDSRFGRCFNFVIYDTTTNQYTFFANRGINSPHGAGVAAAQQIIDEKVDAVITGNMGPNAMELIKAAGIEIYSISGGTVEGAVDLFLKGRLEKINQAAPAHSGMGQQGRRGW